MARVSCVNVTKIYAEGRGAAVMDVSLDVADGEFVVLVDRALDLVGGGGNTPEETGREGDHGGTLPKREENS